MDQSLSSHFPISKKKLGNWHIQSFVTSFVHDESTQVICRGHFSSWIWLSQALGFLPCPPPRVILLPDAACCRRPCFGRGIGLDDQQRSLTTLNILWFCDSVTQSTVLLDGGMSATVQIINSGLYFFLRRSLICLWKRLSSMVSYDSRRLGVTHRVTLMAVILYTRISYSPGCTWADSDDKSNLCCFGAICAIQILWLLCQSSRGMLYFQLLSVLLDCANTQT